MKKKNDRRNRVFAALLLAGITAVTAAFPAMAAGWSVNDAGKWTYTDDSGEPLRAAVTPDGYLTDVFGVWDETPYDSLVGTYRLVSDTVGGEENTGGDADGISETLRITLNTEQHLVLKTVWAYPNGSVMRSAEDEYYPNTNGTFSPIYYTERRGNEKRWRDISSYSNYGGLTDNGNGQLTLVAEEDGGTRTQVWQKQ